MNDFRERWHLLLPRLQPQRRQMKQKKGSFSFIFSDTSFANFAETFFSLRDKSMR
jgi:hypothetical protein